MVPLRFGFSPCPNDTFAFHDAVTRENDGDPIRLEPVLADIEALNRRALASDDPLEVTKLSLPALARVAERYSVLPAGAALGFGCGPLVVCRDDAPWRSLEDLASARIAIPGRNTTACLLMALLTELPLDLAVEKRFDEVMTAVEEGAADAGLVIHEGRFTYRGRGLRMLADLGERWEKKTGGPLPLGVIAVRNDLDDATFAAIGARVRDSVRAARRDPESSHAFVRRYAQEMDEEVCERHIALYVNDFTEDLGDLGRSAIENILSFGRAAGIQPEGPMPFREEA